MSYILDEEDYDKLNCKLSRLQENVIIQNFYSSSSSEQLEPKSIGRWIGPTGSYYGDYIYWDDQEWKVGSENVTLGRNSSKNTSDRITKRIAIGEDAGRYNQGGTSIAIGYKSGYTGQHQNSIILNATGINLDASSSGFFVAPISNKVTHYPLYYDTSSNEISYSRVPSASTQLLLKDNNDISWNLIASIENKQVVLQIKNINSSTMKTNSSLILGTLDLAYRTTYEVTFLGFGYVDDINFHQIYYFIIKTNGTIEIKNIDNTIFNSGKTINIYPTTFSYHVL